MFYKTRYEGLTIVIFCFFICFDCIHIYAQELDPVQREIRRLGSQLKENPNDVEALRELGILCVYGNQFGRARKFLEKAYRLDDRDGKTVLYYGLSLEFLGLEKEALERYFRYTELYPGPYQRYTEGRYYHLSRKLIRGEMQNRLKLEGSLLDTAIVENRVVVFPLVLTEEEGEHAIYGYGLTEMLRADLNLVAQIQVVDRIRVQILTEEASLEKRDYLKQDVLSRMGKILGARWSLGGSLQKIGESIININFYLRDIIETKSPTKFSTAELLENMIDIEKTMVFDILSAMNIPVTEEIKEKIENNRPGNIRMFKLFCQGLAREASGETDEAFSQFLKLNDLDPSFQPALRWTRETMLLTQIEADKNKMLYHLSSYKNIYFPNPSVENLVLDRLQNISINLGAFFLPGRDSRQSTAEAYHSGLDLGLGDLPDPPSPPER